MKRLAVLIMIISSIFGVTKINAQVAVGISVEIAPPELPVYEQPICPGDGYFWTPGYWAWGPDGYYWVPGVWVIAPEIGFLWTPGYWGFDGGHYWWHGGYWGPHIGYYGGVCYGYGYWGHGFYGGRWEDGRFRYNSAAWRVGSGIHNTYVDRTAINNNPPRTSYNGRGGIESQPTPQERTAMTEHHVQPTSVQQTHEHAASLNKNQYSSVNHGKPAIAAKSTVEGPKNNSTGHPVAGHPAGANHPAPANHFNNPAATHPANNMAHAPQQQHNTVQNRPAPQQQHNNMQNRPALQQQLQSPMQNRSAPQQHMAQPQHQNGGMQRSAPPQGGGQHQPQGGGGGRH